MSLLKLIYKFYFISVQFQVISLKYSFFKLVTKIEIPYTKYKSDPILFNLIIQHIDHYLISYINT